MDSAIRQELKVKLEEERDRLVAELTSIAKPDPRRAENWNASFPKFAASETGSHSSLDEQADEVEEFETRLEAEHSLESRLLDVTRALERIQTDRYGRCHQCGAKIPLQRLRANPAAETDLAHGR